MATLSRSPRACSSVADGLIRPMTSKKCCARAASSLRRASRAAARRRSTGQGTQTRGHDRDDAIAVVAELHGAIDHARIGAEVRLPDRVTQERGRDCSAGHRRQPSTCRPSSGATPSVSKKFGVTTATFAWNGSPPAREAAALRDVRGELLERLRLVSPVVVVRRRDRVARLAGSGDRSPRL